MTRAIFLDDPYLRDAPARVLASGEGTVTLDASLFYAQGGGQPTGRLNWAENPSLVKTIPDALPVGQGRVRLIRIGDVDLQPCGGTHVARTGEI